MRKEKDNIARNYQELKNKMKQFRDEEVSILIKGKKTCRTSEQFKKCCCAAKLNQCIYKNNNLVISN